jgi:molybdopterin synthase catalytic subunit
LDLPEGGTVESAWEAVASRFPVLQPYRPFTLFALGTDYVQPTHLLRAGDELCFFPPVSGGAGEDLVEVTAEPLSEERIMAAVGDPAAGGLVLFSGVVRNETGGRRVKYLEYEAHAPMAAAKMREIASAVRLRWPGVRALALVHRIGRLEIGESSVMIAVSSPHRGEAFDACRFAIDTLKETVPVWKKEYFEDGEVWVGLQGDAGRR